MKSATRERGGFVLGLIVGLLVGLALALGVALYVTHVPIPFVMKVQPHTPEQDAAEAQRNKNWDPNAQLAGKQVKPVLAEPASAASSPAPAPASASQAPLLVPAGTATVPHSVRDSTRDPAAILSGQAVSPAAAPMLGHAASSAEAAGAFTYFVQVGAFAQPEEAEQQRAKVGLLGLSAKVSERDQQGRTVYRVRLGPFDRREDADAVQGKLQQASVESALVRVENAPAAH